MIKDLIQTGICLNNYIKDLGIPSYGCTPKVYLEFTNIGDMHKAERDLMEQMPLHLQPMAFMNQLDSGTLSVDFGGVTFILRCLEKYAGREGKVFRYNEIEKQVLLKPIKGGNKPWPKRR